MVTYLNHFKQYSSLICFSVLPLVSMSNFLLTNKEATLQAAKNKNNGTDVPNALLRIGNAIMTSDADAQLANVENGITSGSTVSAMYSHMTGPRESPKLAM